MTTLKKVLLHSAALALLGTPALHAQVATIQDGVLGVAGKSSFQNLLSSQTIGFTFTHYVNTAKYGGGFKIANGAVDTSDGAGSAMSNGIITFTEGTEIVELSKLDLLGTLNKSYVTAIVTVNGKQKGRFPVFLLDTNLYTSPTRVGTFTSAAVNFRINPDFLSEFDDYIPIVNFDPNSVIGTFSLSCTLAR